MMRTVFIIARRSVLLFLRDKATVFFSFLSTLILIALYFLFIGKSYADGMAAETGGLMSSNTIYSVVYVQMMVGVLVLNSLSLSIGAFTTIAADFEQRRVDSFLMAPIRPSDLLFAYLSGAYVISFTLNVFTWLVSILIIGLAFGYWVSVGALFAVVGVMLFASLVSCSIMLLVTALVKSSAAIGVFSGVAGTFFGFLCGIYMPYEVLGKGVEYFGSILPFTHLTIWMKQIVLNDAFVGLSVPEPVHGILLQTFSAENIGLLGFSVPLSGTLIYTAVIALGCLAIAERIIRRRLTAGH